MKQTSETDEGVFLPVETYHDKVANSVQLRYWFTNGYGASVIKGPYTFGGPQGLWELAVITEYGLCFTTPITEDVIGHLTPESVQETLREISALPKYRREQDEEKSA